MLKDERFRIIGDYLKENDIARISVLMELTDASVDTIRRDLEALEKRGILRRVHGGAVCESDSTLGRSFGFREVKNRPQKIELASKVVELIKEGQSVALNSGTTNIEVAKVMIKEFSQLTIITNSLRIAQIFADADKFTVLLPGGILSSREYSLTGRQCEELLAGYNIDVAVIAANALSIKKGVTDFRMEEIGVIRAMINNSDLRILAADSSKFEKTSLVTICPLQKMNYIVTDSDISEDIIKLYMENDIKVVI